MFKFSASLIVLFSHLSITRMLMVPIYVSNSCDTGAWSSFGNASG
jgi:hypothetical protein